MAERKSYWELLRDPQWQRKRLEVLSRSDFACETCGTKEHTLNVHHKHYRKGAKPWEYADHELVALCEPCHERQHDTKDALNEAIALLSDQEMEIVLGFVQALPAVQLLFGAEVTKEELDRPFPIRSTVHAIGVGHACGLTSWDAMLDFDRPKLSVGDVAAQAYGKFHRDYDMFRSNAERAAAFDRLLASRRNGN